MAGVCRGASGAHQPAKTFGFSSWHDISKSATVRPAVKLKTGGFAPLEISPNYYDDLAARFALDDDWVARLRKANILYDRDDRGEHFQLYSPNYGEGFFFEIVERRGGYRGYGAANAQFRIAAQKRALEREPAGRPWQPRETGCQVLLELRWFCLLKREGSGSAAPDASMSGLGRGSLSELGAK